MGTWPCQESSAEADYDISFDPGSIWKRYESGGGSDDGEDRSLKKPKAQRLSRLRKLAHLWFSGASVGFNRAPLMEELEVAGVIGPAREAPRKVLRWIDSNFTSLLAKRKSFYKK